MKKVLSVLLSVLMVVLSIVPAMSPIIASAAKSSDAYSVIFTASDFQSDTCYANFTAMMNNAQDDGITETPEAFLFGGDYTASDEDPATQVPKITDTVQSMYSGYDEDHLIYVQGNHDTANEVLTPTGLHEFENFFVYSINEDDFKKEQAGRTPLYDETVKALAGSVAAEFEQIKQTGDTRPIFVITHVPLHHTSRDNYGDNVYSKYLFDVLNEYGKDLDIIFLFGHNHSSTYDDYIGGAVNYIAKGETIRIPVPDESKMGATGYTEETLNFTYMNAGYVGYSNNSPTAPSTNTLTMGAFELCPTTIEISRYSTAGLYTTETITRVNPSTTDPYVRVSGETTGTQGNSDILYGYSGNIEGATYTWSTSDGDSVVKVLPAGKNAQVIYTGEGTADVTLTVTDTEGNKYTDTMTITVAGATTDYNPVVSLKRGTTDVDGRKLKFYEVTYGEGFMLDGSFTGFVDHIDGVTTEWSSTNPAVATVENGYVTFVSSGKTTINYVVTEGTTTITKSVNLLISRAAKLVDTYELTDDFQPGKSYIIANVNTAGEAYIMGTPSIVTNKNGYNIRMTAVPVTIDEINGTPTIINSNDSVVWNAVSDDNGNVYLVNEMYGTYLHANDDTTDGLDLDVTTDKTVNGTIWSQYSSGFLVSDDGYGMHYSADVNFRACASGSISKQFIYEKAKRLTYVHIRSKYVNVENTTLERFNVAPYQSETLMGKTELFFDDSSVAYEWTSSNHNVATIDNAGVLTYTGNPGETTITVVATSTIPNEDGSYDTATASVTINVAEPTLASSNDFVLTDNFVDGKNYVIAPANSGSSVMLSDLKVDGNDETRLEGVTCTIENGTITTSDQSVIWTAEDAGNGYFRLKNVATGEYLALYAVAGETVWRRVTTASLSEFDKDAYLLERTEDGLIYSKQSRAYKNSTESMWLSMENDQFRLSKNPNAIKTQYIYEQQVPEDGNAPKTQIRVSTFLGTNDITNVLQNRYNIQANDTEQLLRYTENFASITSTNWSVSDESVATIDKNGLVTYTGKEGFVTVTLVVTGKDINGETVTHTVKTTLNVSNDDYIPPTEDYPEYPHEGSVRINKTASNSAGGRNFQDSGVTEVELSVTGVPLPQAVDVVVVLDHSSSMTNDGSGLRLTNAIANTRDFALQLVNSNKNNRIAIVTFDRYSNIYEHFTDPTANHTTNPESNEDRIVTGDGTAEGAFMTFDDSEELIAQIDSLATNNTGGTNYDYGLQQAYDILKAAKSDPDANKIQYVVFMSDGEPYAFNRVQRNGNEDNGLYEAWLRGDESNAILAGYLADTTTYPSAQYFNTRGENWFAEIIKTPEGETLSDMPEIDYYKDYREGLGATIFTIGFEAGEQGSLTCDILTTMASTAENYYYAEGDIQSAYDSILEQIVFAANNAVVTDKMGENFSLQVAPSLTLGNDMSTIEFDPAPCIEIGSWTLNSDGTRNTYTEIEKITFKTDSDGTLTAAYSDLIDNTNIYDATSNKIIGSKVTYDLTNETFTWNIGDITRDEITLKYYAYLEGSAEGEREAGTFDTNEYAYMDYLNYLGTECQQTFPVPSLGWKEAVVSYEFYLVNDKGEPVNRDGIVVPFAERVLVGQEQSKSINLNSSAAYSAITLVAKEEVPAGYVLFNENTEYHIKVSSGDNPSEAIIYDAADIKTTYFRDGTIIYSGDGVVQNVTDYTNTHVSFAIKNVGGIAPDSVVIDYGLPVKISVLANDINATKGTLTLIGTKLDAGTEFNVISYTESKMHDGVTTGLVLPNGTASIEGDKVVFTPSNLTMNTENVFYYEYRTDTGVYMYAEVTVIPAANIYYEESFFTFTDGDGYEWKTADETLAEKFQAEDRPGTFSFAEIDANNVYGMDHAYDDSYTYSLGSAMYTSVDADAYGKEPTAEFTFCGTGFDLFSVTNNDTGAVLVSVYKTGESLYKNFIVQTYYGYSYEDDQFVPTPDSGGCLYQVPVISARNLGYDTYRVVIKPIYSTMFDTEKDGSYDIYIDSVRIYDPADEKPAEDSVIGDAYIEDGEYAPEFAELRNTILDSETFYSSMLEGTEYGEGSVFIDGISSLDESGISDKFLEAGPNNEVYLAKGQAIAFHLVSDTEISPASVQLGMKTVFGEESVVALMNTNNLTPSYITVSGAHEMYRRLASAIVWDATALATGKYQTKYPIVIVNTSDSILSLTQLKWAFENGTGGEVQLVVDSETPRLAYAAVRSVMASFPYTDEDISMEWSDTSPEEGTEVTLTITTPADIAKITIDGVEITEYTINENGEKEWTYTFTVVETGENTYDILLFADNGKVSQPMATETITVTEAQVETNFFSVILELIKRILAFFKAVFA